MIKKGVIPAAGFGTRMFPLTVGFKKEFLPLIDHKNNVKPAIQIIIEEIIDAGVEEVCLIVQPEDEEVFRNYFDVKIPFSLETKLRKNQANSDEIDRLRKIGKRLSFAYQTRQEGFGHAVYSAREFVGNNPFILLLGDQVCLSHSEKSCARQLIEKYDGANSPDGMIALTRVHEDDARHYGCAELNENCSLSDKKILKIKTFTEKPEDKAAINRLKTSLLPEGFVFCVLGEYIFSYQIFDYLKYEIENNLRVKGEFQLTTAMDRLCRGSDKFYGYETIGEYLDIGRPESYLKAINIFAKK